MTDAEQKHLSQWIEKAEHDLIAAKLIIEHNPLILDIVCFHSQQAVEKYLKLSSSLKKKNFPGHITWICCFKVAQFISRSLHIST